MLAAALAALLLSAPGLDLAPTPLEIRPAVAAPVVGMGGDGPLLVASESGAVDVLDPLDGTRLRRLTAVGEPLAFAVSVATGRAVGGRFGEVVLWDLTSGGLLATSAGSRTWVKAVAFSPDGARVASGDDDGVVRLHDGATLRVQATFPAPADRDPTSGIQAVAFSPDGQALASVVYLASSRSRVELRETATGRTVRSFTVDGLASRLAYSPDGTLLAVGGDTLALLDARTGALVRTLTASAPAPSWGAGPAHGALAWSPDGALVAAGDGNAFRAPAEGAAALRVWDVATGVEVHRSDAFAGSVRAVHLDGRVLAAGDERGVVRIWRRGAEPPPPPAVAAGAPELEVQTGHPSLADAVAVDPAGERLVSADSGTVIVWDLRTRRQLRHFPFAFARQVAFGPGPDQVAVLGDGEVVVLDVATGRRVGGVAIPAERGSPPLAALSRDGSRVAFNWQQDVLAPRRTDVFSTLDGQRVRTFAGGYRVSLDREGRRLATADLHDRVTTYDVDTGAELGAFSPGAIGATATFALAPDGSALAIGLDDGLHAFAPTGAAAGGVPGPVAPPGQATWGDGGWLVWFDQVGPALTPFPIALVEVATGRRVELGPIDAVKGVAAQLPGTQTVAAARNDGALALLGPGGPAGVLQGHARWVQRLALSDDGTRLAVQDLSSTALVDLASGKVIRFLPRRGKAMALTRDGGRLASADLGGVSVLEAGTGAVTWTRTLESLVSALAFSRDGSELAVALYGEAGRRVERWSARDGAVRAGAACGDWKLPAEALAFSDDGRAIAATNALEPGLVLAADRPARTMTGRHGRAAALRGAYQVFADEERILVRAGGSDRILHELVGHASCVEALAFLDAERLASAGCDGTVRLWNVRTGAALRVLQGHTGHVVALAASGDGKLLASAGLDDATVILWNTEDGSVRARLVFDGAGGLVAATPSGDFLATRAALQAVAFRAGGRALPFEAFDLAHDRPDRVLAAVGRTPGALVAALAAAHRQRLERLGLDERALAAPRPLPTVRVAPGSGAAVATAEVELELTAEAAGAPLAAVSVFVNGVPAPPPALAPRARAWRGTARVPLAHGENRIEVLARDVEGVESLPEVVQVSREGTALPHRWVLAVGISAYPASPLGLASADARDVADLLGRQLPPERYHALVLTDAQATREAILASRAFLEQAGVDDEVIVFLAGHGLRDARLAYRFAPVDVDFARPEARGIAYEELEALLAGLRAQRMVLLLDSCFSGGSDTAGGARRVHRRAEGPAPAVRRGMALEAEPEAADEDVLLDDLFVELRRGAGASVIAAARGDQAALEAARWGNGAFTAALRRGLETGAADLDHDGVVTVNELRAYVADEVTRMTRGLQRPVSRRDNVVTDFALWRTR